MRPIQPDHLHRSHGGLHPPHARAAAAEGALPPEACDDPRASPLPSPVNAPQSKRMVRDARATRARFRAVQARATRLDFPNYVRDALPDRPQRPVPGPSRCRTPSARAQGNSRSISSSWRPIATAGLAFVVLKTVIAEDPAGGASDGSMGHPRNADCEWSRRRSQTGREGVDRHLEGPGAGMAHSTTISPWFVRRRPHPIGRDGRGALGQVSTCPGWTSRFGPPSTAIPPSASRQRGATTPCRWRKISLHAGGRRPADERNQILRWLREVPDQIRRGTNRPVRLALKR